VRTKISSARKREIILAGLTPHWRVRVRGFVSLASRQLKASGLSSSSINAFGRSAYREGKIEEIDGERVLITYARGGWSVLPAPY